MRIETHDLSLDTLDGLRLEADLVVPDGAVAAAVLCHPHPAYGGDRHNQVVDTLFRTLPAAGIAVLRFDFRGAGGSDGVHGGGTDERLDVAAAADALAAVTDAGLWLVGYSFGAAVALDVAHPRADGWVAVAAPLTMSPRRPLAAGDHRPKHLVVARHDQFCDPDATAGAVAGWPATDVVVVEGADHFLAGHVARVATLVTAAITG